MDATAHPGQPGKLATARRALGAHPSAVVFAAALVPRLVFLFELRARSPTFDAPEGVDAMLYDRIASGAAMPARAFFHSPLYIGFLKLFYRTVGRDLFALRLVQHLAGALACALVAQISLVLFRSRAWALTVGLLCALLGPVIFYEGQLGVDALMPLGVVGCAALALSAWRRRDPPSYGLLGASLGVTALGRPVVLAWVPLLLVWAAAPGGARWRRTTALLVGVALAILPVTYLNWRAEGIFVPITANGGLNFYVGNNEAADGAYVPPEGLAFRPGEVTDDYEGRRAAEDAEGRRLTSADVSAWWSSRAWAFLGAHPDQALWLALSKVQLMTSDVEYPQLHDYRVYREVAPILRVLPTAGVVVVPGLAGLLWMHVARERRPLARRYALLALAYAASFVPFFVVGRYRAPWLLLLAPFAGSLAQRVVEAYRERAWRSLVAPAVLAAAAACMSAWSIVVPGTDYQYMAFAEAALTRGDAPAAAHWCERALRDDPDSAEAVALLGRLRREEGRYDEADAVLAASLERAPRNSAAWLELGRVRLATGRTDEAVEALLASVDADPRSLEAWTALAGALRAAGREEDALHADRSLARLRASMTDAERSRDRP